MIVSNTVAIQAETQKLNSQKQSFEHIIAEHEKGLRDAIDSADTTDRDARYVLFCVLELLCCKSDSNIIHLVKCVRKIVGLMKTIQMKSITMH